jgi:hemerythrin-like domain-containing protein
MARAARKAAESEDSAAYSAAVERIEAHWQTVLAAHFAQEEVLVRLAEESLDAEAVARFFAEHAELRRLACGPCALEPAARLRRFGDLLAAHVRFEERVLFPQLQSHPRVASVSI